MSGQAINNVLLRIATVVPTPGPIFTKELRVSGRRGRYYMLRFAYVAVLTAVVAYVWQQANPVGSARHAPAYMSEIGKRIVLSVAWFQFFGANILAVVLLSNGISVELRQRTLGLLASTPITGLQIAAGKLLSKLWHVILLLAISLPVLAIVRVFGGVSWDFVISTTAVTISSTLFVGAVSLYYSGRYDHPLSAMWRTVLFYALMSVLLPLVLGFWDSHAAYFVPYMAMREASASLRGVGTAAGTDTYWMSNCLLMLVLTGLVLLHTAGGVRKVAMEASVNGGRRLRRKRRPAAENRTRKPSPAELRRGIRRVRGAPLVWKELRFYLPARRIESMLAWLFVAAVIACSYAGMASQRLLDDKVTHLIYGQIYFWCGSAVLGFLAAGAVSSERSGGTLMLLLTTPLTDASVILAKAVGVFRQALPAWMVLLAHLLLFTAAGIIHPVVLPLMAIIVLSTSAFLAGLGLYWSTRLHSSVSAVIAAGVVVAVVWLLPVLLLATDDPNERLAARYLLSFTPAVQVAVTIQGGVEKSGFQWPIGHSDSAGALAMTAMSLAAHGTLGLLFAWRAKAILRRKLFE